MARVELSAKVIDLEEELSLEREQLRKAEGVSSSLKLANKELEACISSFNTQLLEAQQEAEDIYEEVDKAQRIGVLVGFRILRQLLLQLELGFDI